MTWKQTLNLKLSLVLSLFQGVPVGIARYGDVESRVLVLAHSRAVRRSLQVRVVFAQYVCVAMNRTHSFLYCVRDLYYRLPLNINWLYCRNANQNRVNKNRVTIFKFENWPGCLLLPLRDAAAGGAILGKSQDFHYLNAKLFKIFKFFITLK